MHACFDCINNQRLPLLVTICSLSVTYLLDDLGSSTAAALTDEETEVNPVAADTALSNRKAELKFIV